MKVVSSCCLLVAAVCATVQGAPQSSSSSNKPDTRFFNQGGFNQGGFNQGGLGFQQGGFPIQQGGFPIQQGGFIQQGSQGLFPGAGGVGQNFPQPTGQGQGAQVAVGPGGFAVTVPPNVPVNVVDPNTGSVVGVPIEQCSFFCRNQFTGQYGCCDNTQQSHPGQCPTPRPVCPPIRNFGGPPKFCKIDIDCQFPNKCCLDTCLEGKVCKPGFLG